MPACNVLTPLPLVIGVTGHRDIPAAFHEALEAQVGLLLQKIRAQYPACSLRVLSSLADGADRICVKAALKAGADLHVPLPFEAEEYKRDFEERSACEFDDLMANAQSAFVVSPIEEEPNVNTRGFYYRQAGLYIAKHAHMLIALWDGEPALYPEGGGTYETIRFMEQEGGIVYVINAPRADGVYTPSTIEAPPDQSLRIISDFL